MTLLDTGKNNATELRGDSLKTLTNWKCPYGQYRMVNKDTGESRPFDCKSWRCLEHGPQQAWRWCLRIGAIPWELMVTFTKVPENRLYARKGWTAIMRYLRSVGITGFVKAMELGASQGMRHYHVLLVGASWVSVSALNLICARWGHGFVWITPVKQKTKAARYVLKYALKSLGEPNLRFRGWRTVTTSRSIPSWKDVQRKYRGDTFVEEGWTLCRI